MPTDLRWNHRRVKPILPFLLTMVLAWPALSAAVDCVFRGEITCTVTHQMSAGVFMDRSDGTPDCIQGTTGDDDLRMGEEDQACMLGGSDMVTVERDNTGVAIIDFGNGTDRVNCQGSCSVTKENYTGSVRVDCDTPGQAVLWGGGGQDKHYIYNDCDRSETHGGGNDDLVELLDCTALDTLIFHGGGGTDTLNENLTPGCHPEDYSLTMTSVEEWP